MRYVPEQAADFSVFFRENPWSRIGFWNWEWKESNDVRFSHDDGCRAGACRARRPFRAGLRPGAVARCGQSAEGSVRSCKVGQPFGRHGAREDGPRQRRHQHRAPQGRRNGRLRVHARRPVVGRGPGAREHRRPREPARAALLPGRRLRQGRGARPQGRRRAGPDDRRAVLFPPGQLQGRGRHLPGAHQAVRAA